MKEQIERAVGVFRNLLEEEYERLERMKIASGNRTRRETEPILIGLVEGDGIGPIIMEAAGRTLEALLEPELRSGRVRLRKIEGLTLEKRIEEGRAVPEKTLSEILECDVLLKGPTATVHGGSLESANVALRRELGLYANIRPVRIPEKKIDWVFFRENSEGEYALGSRGIQVFPEMAVDFKVTTDIGTERIARAAFEYARANGKTKVAIVTKANIIKKTDGMFSEIAHKVAADYPEILAEDWYVDIMAANLVNEEIRSGFQVFLLPNLYGDILTDEAAEIQGGVGTAGSANVGDRYAMFEAIHGTAPRMIAEGLGDYANPASILRATAMMLRHIGIQEKADRLEKALDQCLEKFKMTGRPGGTTSRDFTDGLIKLIETTE